MSLFMNILLVSLSALVIGVLEVNSSTLQIVPRYHQSDLQAGGSYLCSLKDDAGQPIPLSGCGFKRYDTKTTWDFALGPSSTPHSNGTYHGEGLNNGQCGISFNLGIFWGSYIVGCRVRPAAGGAWQYEAAMFYSSDYFNLKYTHQPRSLVALPGSEVSILGHADEHQLMYCRFHYHGAGGIVEAEFHKGASSPGTSAHHYHGSGLDKKECGVTLADVKPENSGFVWSGVGGSPSPHTHVAAGDFSELIVAEAPSSRPQLALNSPSAQFTAGDTLHATCLVKQSRPVANVTWYLGDRLVRQDGLNEEPVTSEWRWNFDPQSITQHLNLTLAVSDDGLALKCRAGHFAWPSGSSDSEPVVIHVAGGH